MSATAVATRQCCVCGKDFEPRSHNQECCSPPPGKRRSQCSARLNNHRTRGTALTAALPSPFDCEQCGTHCIPGVTVAPHATRFCGGNCKREWHRKNDPTGRVAEREEERIVAAAIHDLLTWPPELKRGEEGRYKQVLLNDPCCYCGAPSEARDHIVPRCDGGPDDWTNRVGACHRCNSVKQSTPLLLFLGWKQARDTFEPWRRIVAEIHTRS